VIAISSEPKYALKFIS